MPSAWLRPLNGEDGAGEESVVYPLKSLVWRKDGSSSMAALMILIALSIRLNESLKGRKFELAAPRPTTVAVTYDELQRMTGFARATVSGGVEQLVMLGAISRVKIGRTNHYDITGLNTKGGWCQIPQTKLLQGDGSLSIKKLERKRVTLYALKLYVLFMARRRQAFNTASISYAGIMKWTGMRRADIGPAVQLLIAWELVDVSEEIDDRHIDENDRSKRYRIRGLKALQHQSAAA